MAGATRRQLLAFIAMAGSSAPLLSQRLDRPLAIAFDAFVLFSPQAVLRRARAIAGEKADALTAAATARLFSYTWYYTSADRYVGFDELAADAFKSAGQSVGLNLASSDLDSLVEGYSSLELWPDVHEAINTLRRRGVRLAMLSNLSARALSANLRKNGIADQFEFILSTDQAQLYKPSPKAYVLAARAFHLPRNQIGFAASASWDASGATWFGYPTVWVNRNNAPIEQAHAKPALVSSGMSGVLELAGL